MGLRLLHDLRPCDPQETEHIADYLADTPMDHLAPALAKGTHRLSKAVVRSRDALGGVSTCWEELGGFLAEEIVGRHRYLVREAFPVLMQPQSHDEEGQEAVLHNLADWEHAQDGAAAILLYEGGGFTLLDWNKRTVAFYQRTASDGDAIEYPVYIVHRAGVQVPLELDGHPPPKAEERTLQRR